MTTAIDRTTQKILSSKDYTSFKELLKNSDCKRCQLHTGRTQIVVDRGNPKSRVMIVGEAPGEQEDREGKAFVGRSGKLLHELLLEIGFDSNQDALIANIAKCRPPKNRAPEKSEANCCKIFLEKQIELVSPGYLLLLGNTARSYLLGSRDKAPLSKIVGQWIGDDRFSAKIMALFHPAYILRDPRKKPLMREHLLTFVKDWSKSAL